MSRPIREWLSDIYKAKLSLWYICEFMRETDSMGEWGRSTKEISLVEFQQWVWKKIPPEDEEWLSQTVEARKKRNYRAKLKTKKDYENLLKSLKEQAKRKN